MQVEKDEPHSDDGVTHHIANKDKAIDSVKVDTSFSD